MQTTIDHELSGLYHDHPSASHVQQHDSDYLLAIDPSLDLGTANAATELCPSGRLLDPDPSTLPIPRRNQPPPPTEEATSSGGQTFSSMSGTAVSAQNPTQPDRPTRNDGKSNIFLNLEVFSQLPPLFPRKPEFSWDSLSGHLLFGQERFETQSEPRTTDQISIFAAHASEVDSSEEEKGEQPNWDRKPMLPCKDKDSEGVKNEELCQDCKLELPYEVQEYLMGEIDDYFWRRYGSRRSGKKSAGSGSSRSGQSSRCSTIRHPPKRAGNSRNAAKPTASKKGKLTNGTGDDEDSDHDGDRDDDNKGKKKAKATDTCCFACPYFKWNPRRFKGTCRIGYETMSRLKTHLKEKHRAKNPSLCCPGCGQHHASNQSLLAHRRALCATASPAEPFEIFMTQEQSDFIDNRLDRKLSGTQKWEAIYKKLLPGPCPSSPYPDKILIMTDLELRDVFCQLLRSFRGYATRNTVPFEQREPSGCTNPHYYAEPPDGPYTLGDERLMMLLESVYQKCCDRYVDHRYARLESDCLGPPAGGSHPETYRSVNFRSDEVPQIQQDIGPWDAEINFSADGGLMPVAPSMLSEFALAQHNSICQQIEVPEQGFLPLWGDGANCQPWDPPIAPGPIPPVGDVHHMSSDLAQSLQVAPLDAFDLQVPGPDPFFIGQPTIAPIPGQNDWPSHLDQLPYGMYGGNHVHLPGFDYDAGYDGEQPNPLHGYEMTLGLSENLSDTVAYS